MIPASVSSIIPKPDPIMSTSATTDPAPTMSPDQTFLAKARKARFDDLPTFSGHSSENVERFFKRIKNTIRVTDDADNRAFLEMIRGKLTHSAGLWFDKNEASFPTWLDFETAFRNRYFPTNLADTIFAKLKCRKQQPGESFTSYSDDVLELCHDFAPDLPDRVVIHHLMSGLHPELKIELSRRASSLQTLDEFLKHAQIEQDLYDTYKAPHHVSLESQHSSSSSQQAAMSSVATVSTQRQPYHSAPRPNTRSSPSTPSHQSAPTRQPSHAQTPRRTTVPFHSQSNPSYNRSQPVSQHSFSPCKVCGRKNHRTIDCFRKRPTGCFNCGAHHSVRDCPLPPNFQ